MSEHTVQDLRRALFKQLDALQNPDRDTAEEVSRAKVMSEIGRTILESAKLEMDHSKMTGGSGVQFLGKAAGDPRTQRTPTGIIERDGNVTRHRLQG